MPSKTEIELIITAKNKASKELAKVSKSVKTLEKDYKKSTKNLKKDNDGFIASLGGLKTAFLALGVAAASGAILKFIKDSAFAASRVEELGFALESVGKSSGYSSDEIKKTTASLREGGISIAKARETTLLFMQSQLDLGDATKLARVAQDLAVIGQMDSSEATTTLTQAISSQQVMMLKSFGINTTSTKLFEEYGKTINKTGDSLTQAEQKQAFLNKILKEGEKVTGTYEAAMKSSGKQYRSLTGREIPDMMALLGEGLLPVLNDVVVGSREAVTGLSRFFKENNKEIAFWSSVVANNMVAVFRTIANALQISVKAWAGSFKTMVAFFGDGIANIKNALQGDFSFSVDTAGQIVDEMTTSIRGDMTDMAEGWLDADNAIVNSTSQVGKSFGEFSGGVSDDAADMAEEMSKTEKSMTKSLEKIILKVKDLKKAYKEQREEAEDNFDEETLTRKSDLNSQIAQEIIDAEDEISTIRSELSEATTEDEKIELLKRRNDLREFLTNNKREIQRVGKEIKDIRRFNNLDSIDQLKETFDIEEDERKEAHENELKDLKENYKDKKELIKRELKEIEKEHAEFLNSPIMKKAQELLGVSSSSSGGIDYDERPGGMSKREYWSAITGNSKEDFPGAQFGGAQKAGSPIVVGEHRPEVFVPSQSGNIRQLEQSGGEREITIINNNNISNEGDENRLVDKIKQAISRESSLGMLGVR